jgi:hypothetical protein
MFKTTEFFKRNSNKIRETLSHIVIEIKHVIHGFKSLKKDIRFTY